MAVITIFTTETDKAIRNLSPQRKLPLLHEVFFHTAISRTFFLLFS